MQSKYLQCKSRFWHTYQPPDTHGYPEGGGVAFSNDLGQQRVGSVSVPPPALPALRQHRSPVQTIQASVVVFVAYLLQFKRDSC